MNTLVHHINKQRIGNPNMNLAQILKGLNQKANYSQVPVTNLETLENIQSFNKDSKEKFTLMIQQHPIDQIAPFKKSKLLPSITPTGETSS